MKNRKNLPLLFTGSIATTRLHHSVQGELQCSGKI